MSLRIFLIFFLLLLAAASAVSGQDEKLIVVPPEAFSEAAISLPPRSGFLSDSTIAPFSSAERIYSKWGITLRGRGSTVPTVRLVMPSVNPFFNWSIFNSGSPNAGQSMIIDFDIPVRRIGFFLWPPGAESKTLSAFDSIGELLGTIDASEESGWIGVESAGVQGISKLVIDYGDSEREEEIGDLVVEFVTGAHSFTVYLPQIGDGQAIVGGQPVSFQTAVTVSNLQETAVSGSLQFFDSQGNPMALAIIGGVEDSLFEFVLGPSETIDLTTDGSSNPVASGYAVIRTEGPVAATAGFTIVDQAGEILTAAGISASEPSFRMVGPVAAQLESDLNSGVALVNTSEERAPVRVLITGANFESVELDLEAGEHLAMFIRELFPSLPEEFQGTITIASTALIAATILRTKNGLPLASFQLDSLEQSARP